MADKPKEPPDIPVANPAGAGAANISDTLTTGSGIEGDRDAVPTGATISHRYINIEEDVVGVAVDALRDFRSASTEEFGQFAIGGFFAAGSFWLGLERLASAPIWWEDAVFWFCVVAFLAGLIIGFFGYRQLKRRQTRIDIIIRAADAALAKKNLTDSTGI